MSVKLNVPVKPKAKRYAKVHIEITNVCNLQCSFCPPVDRKKGVLGLERFTKIAEQVAPLAEQLCLHLMGDPLVHPRLREIFDVCERLQSRIFLVTNGVLLKKESIDLLLHPALRQVNFSLHSFHDNFGDKDPTEYLENIFLFTERAFETRPDLYINYRLWNLQQARGKLPDSESMLKRIEDRFQIHIGRNPDVSAHKGRVLKNRLYLHFDTEFVWPDMRLPVLGETGFCYGLSNHFGVLVDGTVVPCCLDKEGVMDLGNIFEMPVDAILASPRAERMLNGFQKGKRVEELCRRCSFISRFDKKARALAQS